MHCKKKMLKNLTALYQQALNQENFPVALRVIELQAKLEGYLAPAKSTSFSIADVSNAQLDKMIQKLEII